MFCNRGIYDQGWTAVTRHSTPWVMEELPPFADDTWELYDTNTDWSQAHDLAAEMPEKLEELKALFLEEARKYNVLPLDDRRVERFNSDIAGRPVLITGKSQLLFGGMGRLTRERGDQRQEQVALGHRRAGGARRWRRRRDRRPGRRVRRLEPLRRRAASRSTATTCSASSASTSRATGEIPLGHAPGTDGVRLRRRRARQGRHRDAVRRRREDRRGPGRGHRADDLLRRRDLRRRLGHRLARQRRLHAARPAGSPARSSGCRSTSTTPPRTSTT